jgi:hypothetical protein
VILPEIIKKPAALRLKTVKTGRKSLKIASEPFGKNEPCQ